MRVNYLYLRDGALVPKYQTSQAAGADLHACIEKPIIIKVGQSVLVPSGIAVELPKGYELQIRPRSGLALNHGVTVLNSPGTVDSDYRGELMALMINHGSKPFTINNGDRIAQIIIAKHETVQFKEVKEFTESSRGKSGFGSTGHK